MSVTKLLRSSLRTATLVSGSPTAGIVGTTEGLAIGDRVRGPGIAAGTTLTAVGATTVTLSANATQSISAQLSFEGNFANPGTTVNTTHPSVGIPKWAEAIAIDFEVTAQGATPTVTYNVQASMDEPETPDSASDWVDPFGLRENAAAETDIGGVVTAIGTQSWTLEVAKRPFRKYRLVTSAILNTTYEADIYGVGPTEQ